MPVYNGAAFVKQAIESILQQSFRSFEFIVINDGSTDSTGDVLSTFNDPRLKIITNSKNLGLIASLNIGLQLAETDLIARMDADDIAHPNRLEMQVNAFTQHKNLVLCCSNYITLRANKRRIKRSKINHNSLKAQLVFSSSISHPTVMMKNPLRFFNIRYDALFPHCEDYRMWCELAGKGDFLLLEQALLEYKEHQQQVTVNNRSEQLSVSNLIRREFASAIGLSVQNWELLHKIGSHIRITALAELQHVNKLLLGLAEQNSSVFTANEFKPVLVKTWLDTCGNSSLGVRAFKLAISSELLKENPISFNDKLFLLAKCLVRSL